tara:strand:- start:70 stop:1050 length:981 start_codon:yes stop_codon:yes gene_type:complete
MKKKVILIGLGNIGMLYDKDPLDQSKVFTHAKSFSLHPDFNLVAGIDIEEGKRFKFTNDYNVNSYSSLNELPKDLFPDIAVISCPTEYHLGILEQIVNIPTINLVLCEKPLAYELTEANKIIEKCESQNIDLFVNYMRLSDPSTQKIKAYILNSVEKNKKAKGFCFYSKGLFHSCSHYFNLFEYILDGFISAKIINKGRKYGHKDIETDFVANFNSGSIVFQSAWEENYSHHTFEIITTSGRIRYEDEGNQIIMNNIENSKDFSGYRNLDNKPEYITSNMKKYQYNVVNMLSKFYNKKAYNLCTGRQALITLKNLSSIKDLVNYDS